MRQFTCPKAVAHPGTNRARCRATALIETNALPLHQTATSLPWKGIFRGVFLDIWTGNGEGLFLQPRGPHTKNDSGKVGWSNKVKTNGNRKMFWSDSLPAKECRQRPCVCRGLECWPCGRACTRGPCRSVVDGVGEGREVQTPDAGRSSRNGDTTDVADTCNLTHARRHGMVRYWQSKRR